jgi:hypothetical protein
MAINKDYIPFIVTGVAAAMLLGYFAYLNVDIKTYPDVEIAANGGIGGQSLPHFGPTEHLDAENSLVPVVNLPHRYPNVSGGNITCLIHHGLSPLRMSKGMDQKWITRPPSEVMW